MTSDTLGCTCTALYSVQKASVHTHTSIADDGDEGVETEAGDVRVGAVIFHGLHQEAHTAPSHSQGDHLVQDTQGPQR